MVCPNCNRENSEGISSCRYCGERLSSDYWELFLKRAESFSKYGTVFPTRKVPGLVRLGGSPNVHGELAFSPERVLERVKEGYKVIFVLDYYVFKNPPNTDEAIKKAAAIISRETGECGNVGGHAVSIHKLCIVQCDIGGKDGQWAEIDFANSCVYL